MFHITYDKQQCFRKLTMILFPVMKVLLEFERFLVKFYPNLISDAIDDYPNLLIIFQEKIYFLGQTNL